MEKGNCFFLSGILNGHAFLRTVYRFSLLIVHFPPAASQRRGQHNSDNEKKSYNSISITQLIHGHSLQSNSMIFHMAKLHCAPMWNQIAVPSTLLLEISCGFSISFPIYNGCLMCPIINSLWLNTVSQYSPPSVQYTKVHWLIVSLFYSN